MKIAIISPFPETDDIHSEKMSGVASYTYDLIRSMREAHPNQELDITVLTHFTEAPNKKEWPVYAEDGSHALDITVNYCFPMGAKAYAPLLNTIKEGGFDTVHLQHETFLYGGPATLVMFPLLLWRMKKYTNPVVTLHHCVSKQQINKDFAKMHHSHIPPILIRCVFSAFFRAMGIICPSLIVHEMFFKQILPSEYGGKEEKVYVIYHGVEDPTISVQKSCSELKEQFKVPADAEQIFGFFGFLADYKGLDRLIAEFTEHAKTHPKSVLLIGGGPHPRHAENPVYQEFLKNLKHQAETATDGQIVWHGFVDGAEVGDYFKLINCLVLPYKMCFGASGPMSLAVGSETPFLVSEPLRGCVETTEVVFTHTPGELSTLLSAFTDEGESGSRHAHVHMLKAERLWKCTGDKTLKLYAKQEWRKKMKKPILFLGAYGQDNLGDEVLLQRCLDFFDRTECRVASAQPSLTREQHNVQTVDSQQGVWCRLKAFLKAKTVIIGGGDQFKVLKKSVGRHPLSLVGQYFIIAVLSKILFKKLYYIGIGIGTVNTSAARFFTNWTIRLSTLVTVRDPKSAAYCKEQVPNANVHAAVDLAFLDFDRYGETPRNAPEATKGRLGIAPVYNIDHVDAFDSITQALGTGMDTFLDTQTNGAAILLPFQTGFNEHHDIVTSNEILEHVHSHRDKCRVDTALTKDSIDDVYASLDYLWGMRLHSLIFACLHGLPFIGFIYDVKVENFLNYIDCAQWGIVMDENFSAQQLLEKQQALEEQYEEVSAHLKQAAADLARKGQINREVLEAIAHHKKPANGFMHSPALPT